MSRQIEFGQELSQRDYDWLVDRGRLEEALNDWECTLADGVPADNSTPRTSEPILAADLAAAQTEAPVAAPEPGTLHSVHPDQVGFIEGTGDVVVEDGDQMGVDEEDVPPYDEWDKADLEAEIDRRNAERDEDEAIVPDGTGKNGNVVKADLVAALEADDESNADSDDDAEE